MGGVAATRSRTGDGQEMANHSNSFSIVRVAEPVPVAILLSALMGARNDSNASWKKTMRLKTCYQSSLGTVKF